MIKDTYVLFVRKDENEQRVLVVIIKAHNTQYI